MGKSQEAYRGHDYRDLGCQVILFQRNENLQQKRKWKGRRRKEREGTKKRRGKEWRGGRGSENLINSIKEEERESGWILQMRA